MKLLTLLLLSCLLSSGLLAAEYPGLGLREHLADSEIGRCRNTTTYILRRKELFVPELTLSRLTKIDGEGDMMPYLAEANKRTQFLVAIGTRPKYEGWRRGTLLCFFLGNQNPKGPAGSVASANAGIFVPARGVKVNVEWRDDRDGSLAIITIDDLRYRLHLKVHRNDPNPRRK